MQPEPYYSCGLARVGLLIVLRIGYVNVKGNLLSYLPSSRDGDGSVKFLLLSVQGWLAFFIMSQLETFHQLILTQLTVRCLASSAGSYSIFLVFVYSAISWASVAHFYSGIQTAAKN